jgi:hypothetical protein
MYFRKLVVCAVAALGLASTPLPATATARLTDTEVKELFDRIEHNRSEFEAALDDALKNSIIKTSGGDVNANEFFDDFEDQVERTRQRFMPDYSSSSEVLALLQYASRIHTWATAQPAGFRGSEEWRVLASDLRRLAAAYNTSLPVPANGISRRVNDAELETAVDSVDELIDAFRATYDSTLAATTGLTAAQRLSAIQQVDAMKSHARALDAELNDGDTGIPQAEALLRQAALVVDTMSKFSLSHPTAVAWTPLRGELTKVAWAYEVSRLTSADEVVRR